MKTFLATAIISAFLFAPAAKAQKSAYKYEVNKPYVYLLESKSTEKQDQGGRTSTRTRETDGSFTFTVLERTDDGGMKVKVDIKSAVMFVEGGGNMNSFGKDLAGKSYTYTMDKFGDVKKGDTTANELEDMSKLILRGIMGFLPYLPPDKMEDGAEWERARKDTIMINKNPIYADSKASFEVDDTKDVNGKKCLVIKAESEQNSTGTIAIHDQDFNRMGEGSGTTTIYYGQDEGAIVKIEATQKGTIVISSPSDPSISVTVTSDRNDKVELVTE